MAALGKLYNSGIKINVWNLYPKIKYPVSHGTPSISSLIKWDHSKNWRSFLYVKPSEHKDGEMKFKIDLTNDSWKFLKGYKIDNKNVLPYSLYLKLVCSLKKNISNEMERIIIFDNVVIHKIQNITEDEALELTVMLQKGSGHFEVSLDSTLLCSGVLRGSDSTVQEKIQISDILEESKEELNCSDVYNELQMRGLQCSGSFRSIHKVSANGSNGFLVSQKEWITFVEGMLQMYIFGSNVKTTQVPLKVIKLIVDLKEYESESQSSEVISVVVDQQFNVVRSGGIELQGIKLMPIERDSSKGLVRIEEVKIVATSPGKVDSRLTPIVQKCREVTNWVAYQVHPGDLNSIEWIEEQSQNNLDGEKVAKVEYATINESDLLLATGKITPDVTYRRNNTKKVKSGLKNFGLEYSGIDSKGTNIMGITGSGTLSSFTTLDPELTWQVPKTWTLQDAATVPLAYAASYMALYLKGEIKKKESVLIFDGISSLGQASINLALSEECEVFTTYSTNEEKLFLKKRYPAINEDHLFCSKGAFENQTLSATKGAGVDLVIYNSSSLNKIESCLISVKGKARVIVLGNLQRAFSESVGMEIFLKEIALYSVIPKKLVSADVNTKKKLADMVKNGIKRGVVTPLPLNLYSREEFQKAFINTSLERRPGKIIVKVQPENSTKRALATSRFLFSNKSSYLIIDNLSLFGFELVNFLVAHGAKHILIASNKKNPKPFFNYRNKIWQESGAQVILREDLDFHEQQNVRTLLKEASKLNPIDVIFDLQRMEETSQKTSSSKSLFTKFLDEESKTVIPGLRQFVVCSTSKDADKNFNDILLRDINDVRLCEQRSKAGLPAIFILWGPIEEIIESKISTQKKIPLLPISQYMEQLEDLIALNTPIVTASYTKSLISKNQERATENKKVEEKDENAKFLEYLYTITAASGDRLMKFLEENKTSN